MVRGGIQLLDTSWDHEPGRLKGASKPSRWQRPRNRDRCGIRPEGAIQTASRRVGVRPGMGMPFQGARDRTGFRGRCPRLGLEKAVGLCTRRVSSSLPRRLRVSRIGSWKVRFRNHDARRGHEPGRLKGASKPSRGQRPRKRDRCGIRPERASQTASRRVGVRPGMGMPFQGARNRTGFRGVALGWVWRRPLAFANGMSAS